MTTEPSGASHLTEVERVTEELRALTERELRPGDQFPTIPALMERFGLGKNVLSRAIIRLKEVGVLSGPPGGKTWVRVAPPAITRHNLRYLKEKEAVLAPEEERASTGVSEDSTGISVQQLFEDRYDYGVVEPPADIQSALELSDGSHVLRRIYTRRHAEKAGVSVAVSYIPYDLISGNPDLLNPEKEPWPGGTMHQLYTVGIELDRIEDHLTVEMPTRQEVKEFDVPPGVPLFRLRKISYSAGTPVEVADIPLPGDRTKLVYTTFLEAWN